MEATMPKSENLRAVDDESAALILTNRARINKAKQVLSDAEGDFREAVYANTLLYELHAGERVLGKADGLPTAMIWLAGEALDRARSTENIFEALHEIITKGEQLDD
jgi:hypothetical protein